MNVNTERVRRGATVLDTLQPGWRDRLDVDRLNLGDCLRCVLGQLYGDYYNVANRIAATGTYAQRHHWLIEHGFIAERKGAPFQDVSDKLTTEWRAYLRGQSYDCPRLE